MVRLKRFVPLLYQTRRSISRGPALKYFYMIHRGGRTQHRDWEVRTCRPAFRGLVCVLLCFIDPRVIKIRNEASSCPGIFSRTLRFYYVAPPVALFYEGRVGYFRNERAYSVESSLQRISSNSLLWKRNKLFVVIQT